MKAVQAQAFGGPEVLHLADLPDPVAGTGEIVIDVAAAGVNPADVYMLTGGYVFKPELPYIPGGDCAGIVSATGPGVTAPAVGARVFVSAALTGRLSGCYAEKVVCRAADAIRVPDSVGLDDAACFGVPYVTAHLALFQKGQAVTGQTVFVHGASGAVGTAAVQLAIGAGLSVIGSAGTKEGRALIEQMGAKAAVDHTADGYLDDVRAATAGQGPNLILEMLADRNLAADLELVAPRGRIVIVGCRGEVTIQPRVAMLKDVDIRGLAIWNAEREDVESALSDIVASSAEGKTRSIVGKRFDLADVAHALRILMAGGARGKILLRPGLPAT